MEKRNNNGFVHIIVYLLIFIIFAFTLYACLDILDLIDVPEKYSISKLFFGYRKEFIDEKYEIEDNRKEKQYKKVQIEDDTMSRESNLDLISSQLESYEKNFINSEIEVNQKDEFSYYNQLDDYAKIIYEELEKNLDNMKSGVYNVNFGTTFDELLHKENGEAILDNSFQLAINALNFDNPELFYIDISKLYLLTRITTKLWVTTYTVEIGANQGQSYLNSSFSSEQDVNEAINRLVYEKSVIKSKLNGSIENQIKGVHDYLIENLEYDSTVSRNNIYNIYGALINKCTVCEGYARAFKYIMDDLEVPCIIACGTAVNSNGDLENHAWNYVQINKQWYAVDVTWDDPVIIGNGYIDTSINYKYYLKGSNEFFTNHVENGDIVGDANFKYPTLSVNNY